MIYACESSFVCHGCIEFMVGQNFLTKIIYKILISQFVETEWQEHFLRTKTFHPYLHTAHMQFTIHISNSVEFDNYYKLNCN